MSSLVIYDSLTGNTQKIANAVFAALTDETKDIRNIQDAPAAENAADTVFVGFWVKYGSCSIDVLRFLSSLHGRRVALFATCGLSRQDENYDSIEKSVRAWIPEDCEYLGCFMCRGRMDISVRNRAESIPGKNGQQDTARFLSSFDEAMLHPDERDLSDAAAFVRSVC